MRMSFLANQRPASEEAERETRLIVTRSRAESNICKRDITQTRNGAPTKCTASVQNTS
jgi:hypothetical protein